MTGFVQEVGTGAVSGLIMAPVIGGGMRAAGKGTNKVTNKLKSKTKPAPAQKPKPGQNSNTNANTNTNNNAKPGSGQIANTNTNNNANTGSGQNANTNNNANNNNSSNPWRQPKMIKDCISIFNKYIVGQKLDPNASFKEIKAAYLKLAIKYHPDPNNTINDNIIKEINSAYNQLKKLFRKRP